MSNPIDVTKGAPPLEPLGHHQAMESDLTARNFLEFSYDSKLNF